MFANLAPEKSRTNFTRLVKKSKQAMQEEFAEAAGCAVRTVRRWIQRLDSISNITYLATILEVDVMALLK